MSSIHLNSKTPGVPDASLDGSAATDSTNPQAGTPDAATLEALAAMGLAPNGDATVARTQANNRFNGALGVTSQPPPLPQDRAPVTPQTQALYQTMAEDMSQAMAMAQPATQTSHAAQGQEAGNTMLRQLSAVSETEAQTPAGQQKIGAIVSDGFMAGALNLGSMSNGGMMAAFMVLQVQNKASGKELTGVLLDMTSEARKASLDEQIKLNMEASAKVKEAAEKQRKLGFLAPLIEAIMAVVAVVITVMSAGSATAVAAMLVGATIGFLAGGAAGGAKKGNGFDIASAFSGAALGAGVASIASKAILLVVEKVAMMMARRGVATVGARALQESAKTMGNQVMASNLPSMGVIAAGAAVGAVGTIAKAGMTYDYEKTTADAKEKQARAKMEKAISEMLQTQYQALSGSLQGMLQTHNTAVNQVLSMLKTQFGAMQKAISQISG